MVSINHPMALNIVSRDRKQDLFGGTLGGKQVVFDKKWLQQNYAKMYPFNFKLSKNNKVIVRNRCKDCSIDISNALYDVDYYIADGSINYEKDELKQIARKLNLLGQSYQLDMMPLSNSPTNHEMVLNTCNLPGVTKLKLPSYIRYVNSNAFINNNYLEEIDLNIVEMVRNYVFYKCSNLRSIKGDRLKCIGESSFGRCKNLEKVQLDSLEEVKKCGFIGDIKLVKLNLPSARLIGADAFSQCTSLKQLSLPSASFLAQGALNLTVNLTDLNLDGLVVMPFSLSGGSHTFSSCRNIRNISLKSLTSLDTLTFQSMDEITELNLPSVKVIYKSVIIGCKKLKRIIAPNCNKIASGALGKLPSLEYVELGDIDELSAVTFSECERLLEVRVNSVGSVSDNVFYKCPNAKLVIKNT